MNIKNLNSVELIEGFNSISTALFRENNLPISSFEDFARLFPDQVYPINDLLTFYEKMEKLNYTDEFVKKLSARNKSDKIIIAGDYDADGVMATSIFSVALNRLGFTNIDFAIPDRHTDGYGLALEKIFEKLENNTLVITVDTGISERENVKKLLDAGADVIVTDHHLPTEGSVPEDILVIDPKLNNDSFADICGAMVAFKLAYYLLRSVGLHKRPFVNILAVLAGIATVSDMMPMLEENRYIVKLTLQEINSLKSNLYNSFGSPLYKMLNSLGCYNFFKDPDEVATEELISFYIAPAINAVSRVSGDASPLVRDIIQLFLNPKHFMPFYSNVNRERQKNTNTVLAAIREADESKTTTDDYLALKLLDRSEYDFEIKGLLGLIANKISSKEKKPTLVGYISDRGTVEFSGRGIPGYNLHDGFLRIREAHPELGLDGGGHAQAMGLRLPYSSENLVLFEQYLSNDIATYREEIENTLYEYNPEDIANIISTMESLAPYGQNFKKIKFFHTGIFRGYDQETKIAVIGDYNFKMFLSKTTADNLIGSEINVSFTVNFTDVKGASFSAEREA